MSFIWDKLPSYIKYPLLATLILIWTPIRVYQGAKDFVQAEVHAYVTPMKEQTDAQIIRLESDIHEIKQDTRDIRNHLLGNKER
jgi:hypothetical protein